MTLLYDLVHSALARAFIPVNTCEIEMMIQRVFKAFDESRKAPTCKMFLCPTELAVLWGCKLKRYSCYRNSLTLPPRALKSKAVHPCDDIFN